MRELQIRKGIPKVAVKDLQKSIDMAYQYLVTKYGNQFDDVGLLVVPETTRGRYCPVKKLAKICVARHWHTYDRKTVGVTADRLSVGYELGTAIVVVHELTHHVQNREGRRYSEVETTKNEIEFMSQVDPEWNKFLKTL